MDERDIFQNLWTGKGKSRTVGELLGHKTDAQFFYNPQGPDGQCWDHAYSYARKHGFAYVEGGVLIQDKPAPTLVRAHAWVEETHADGSVTIHEVTEGYERAIQYRGIEVPDTEEMRKTLEKVWELEGFRGSTIEAIIILGRIGESLKKPSDEPREPEPGDRVRGAGFSSGATYEGTVIKELLNGDVLIDYGPVNKVLTRESVEFLDEEDLNVT